MHIGAHSGDALGQEKVVDVRIENKAGEATLASPCVCYDAQPARSRCDGGISVTILPRTDAARLEPQPVQFPGSKQHPTDGLP
jgi:hypothetical protein